MPPSFMDVSTWIILAIFLFGLTYVVKTVVNFILLNKLNSNKNIVLYTKFWTEVILPTMPFVLGMLLGFAVKGYPYPDGFTSAFSRIAYVASAGLFSGLAFRSIKAAFKLKITQSDPTDNTTDVG